MRFRVPWLRHHRRSWPRQQRHRVSPLFCVFLSALFAGAGLCAAAVEPWQFAEVRSFGWPEFAGLHPSGRLLLASDGVFYGVTRGQGSTAPTVFRIEPGGSGCRVVHRFSSISTNRLESCGGLKEGPGGRLFGVAQEVMLSGYHPALFSVGKDGGDFQVLRRLTNFASRSQSFPAWSAGGEIAVAPNGAVFGAVYGREGSNGCVFRVTADGSYSELRSLPPMNRLDPFFSIFQTEGFGVVSDGQGALFGVNQSGGTANKGMVFRVNQDGSGWSVLHEFGVTPGDGAFPQAALLRATDGNFYGLTTTGGVHDRGQVFRVAPDGNYRALYSFLNEVFQPLHKNLPLMEASDGRLYGCSFEDTFGIVSQIYRLAKDGSGFEIIYTSAVGNPGISTLAEGPDGLLYATSPNGTTTNDIGNFTGSIFRLAPDGSQFAVLHKFSASGGDGRGPHDRLLAARDGTLYGTTESGGKDGFGTVFRVNRDGSGHRVLHDFFRNDPDAGSPRGALVEGDDGWLYGTAYSSHGGSVFRLHGATGEFVVLHRFTNTGGDGYVPTSLARDTNGVLYGTTAYGSAVGGAQDHNGPQGLGTLFRVNTDGGGYQRLHSFGSAMNDGRNPRWPLLLASDGRLYGVTSQGGQAGVGAIFRLHPDGTGYQVLRSFSTNAGQPFTPNGALLEGPAGTLLGTTFHGSLGFGAVFQFNADGSGSRVAHAFTGAEGQGRFPEGGLTRGADGALYGLARAGTNFHSWLLFRLRPDGSGYETLSSGPLSFSSLVGGLTSARDAALYGANSNGAAMGFGRIFRFTPPNYAPRFVPDTLRRLPTGEFSVQILGAAGQEAQLEAADQMPQFQPVLPLRFTADPLSVVAPATQSSNHFYRVQVR